MILLALAVLNAGYLTWRFLLVQQDPGQIGHSLCSFTETIDCDKVLSSPPARAFYVPNAILGLGFLLGCLLWVVMVRRLSDAYRRPALKVLRAMLLLGTAFTFIFWYLLLNLDVFCVLCPVNHISIYLALILCQRALMEWPETDGEFEPQRLWRLAGLSIGVFLGLQIAWYVLVRPESWPFGEVLFG